MYFSWLLKDKHHGTLDIFSAEMVVFDLEQHNFANFYWFYRKRYSEQLNSIVIRYCYNYIITYKNTKDKYHKLDKSW